MILTLIFEQSLIIDAKNCLYIFRLRILHANSILFETSRQTSDLNYITNIVNEKTVTKFVLQNKCWKIARQKLSE